MLRTALRPPLLLHPSCTPTTTSSMVATAATTGQLVARSAPSTTNTTTTSIASITTYSHGHAVKRGKSVFPPRNIFYDQALRAAAAETPFDISLESLLTFSSRKSTPASLLMSANNLRRELPIRLAQRINDLHNLPFIVMTNPHMQAVYEKYMHSFRDFRKFPQVENADEELRFTEMVREHMDMHLDTVTHLRNGVVECMAHYPHIDLQHIAHVLLTSRISRRILADSHLSHHNPTSGYIGIIDPKCSPIDILKRIKTETLDPICETHYGQTVGLEVVGDIDVTFPFIPVHLEYIFVEVLKNSMRATLERSKRSGKPPRPIAVSVGEGKKTISIRISDQGGGIPSNMLDNIWKYGYTTVGQSPDGDESDDGPMMSTPPTLNSPIAGAGFGLPLARAYAEYLGGSLQLQTMPGFGTDLYLKLAKVNPQLVKNKVLTRTR